MRKGEVTLKDIAKSVGKSVAAVSKALHDHADIAPETRAMIQQVAQEMGYRPNITAQRLQKKQTDTLGLVLPTFIGHSSIPERQEGSRAQADPFFTELLSGIADQAAANGFDLLVSTRIAGPEEEEAYRRLVSQQRVDGLLIAQPRVDDWRINFLQAQDIPFVVVGTAEALGNSPGIFLDVDKGMAQGVEHLHAQGRNRLALIPPPLDFTMYGKFTAAFKAAIAKYPDLAAQLTEPVETFSQRAGYQATSALLTSDQAPDGIIACHDLVALGSMAAVQDQGFEVGSDIALLGFGDILLSEYAQPPLTSIHQPTYTMGQQACQMVIDLVSGRNPGPPQTIVEPWLVVRQSSGLALWL